MLPTPTITPWPGISRGTDWTVPIVPGLVSDDVGALEVLDRELVVLDLADDLLVGGEEAGEVERVGVADHGHDERAAAVGLRHVDGEAHVDVLVDDDARLAVGTLEERVLHRRHLVGDGADDGVADQVREADLGQPGALAEPVDDLAVDLEQLGGNVAEARGGGDLEAAFHVGGDGGTGAADRLAGFRLGLGGAAPFGGAASSVVGAEAAGAVGAGLAAAGVAGAGADSATGTSGGAEPWSAAISRTRGDAAAAAARDGVCER